MMPIYNRSVDPGEKRQYIELLKQYRDDANQAVWDQLTPAQISKLSGLLGEKAPKARPPQKKASPRPALLMGSGRPDEGEAVDARTVPPPEPRGKFNDPLVGVPFARREGRATLLRTPGFKNGS
jgi:hypothetical protein